MVLLDVHYMLSYLIKEKPQTGTILYYSTLVIYIHMKHYKGTVSELLGSMEEKKKLREKNHS